VPDPTFVKEFVSCYQETKVKKRFLKTKEMCENEHCLGMKTMVCLHVRAVMVSKIQGKKFSQKKSTSKV